MRGFVEGRLEIVATADEYLVTFRPYGLETPSSRETLRLTSREAVAAFLQEIGTRVARVIKTMDDLRATGSASLGSVFLTERQRVRFHG
jgi:hypothetical protein